MAVVVAVAVAAGVAVAVAVVAGAAAVPCRCRFATGGVGALLQLAMATFWCSAVPRCLVPGSFTMLPPAQMMAALFVTPSGLLLAIHSWFCCPAATGYAPRATPLGMLSAPSAGRLCPLMGQPHLSRLW